MGVHGLIRTRGWTAPDGSLGDLDGQSVGQDESEMVSAHKGKGREILVK